MIIDNNFGNLCMKKGGSFQKDRFSFFSVVNGGEGLTPEPPLVRTPLNILLLEQKTSNEKRQKITECLLEIKELNMMLGIKLLRIKHRSTR